MILAAILLNVVHPGIVLKGPESEFPHLSRKERKMLKQEKKAAIRLHRQDSSQRAPSLGRSGRLTPASKRSRTRLLCKSSNRGGLIPISAPRASTETSDFRPSMASYEYGVIKRSCSVLDPI